MPALADEGAYQHLDIPTGYQVKQILVGTVRDLLEDAKKIGDSLLAPWQKLDAVSTFLLPRFDFIMQGATMEKEYLTAVYKTIRRLAMEWLYLPQRASAELLPAAQRQRTCSEIINAGAAEDDITRYLSGDTGLPSSNARTSF
ncbi:unnamed protein product [Arctia plantaginis]|uniref:Uncharacterized protein n=1 Tax=Arctia plantaginis TaxID=874455 RepID=A0A8S1BET9_ARCPL|nr:unnamed protein product [Arctia plantaginis]